MDGVFDMYEMFDTCGMCDDVYDDVCVTWKIQRFGLALCVISMF